MKTFEELTYFVDTKDYMKAYGKVVESMDKILDKMSVDKNTESEIDRLLEGVTINGN